MPAQNMDSSVFVLIHSPLVGPLTWSKVADEFAHRGIGAIVPALHSDPHSSQPFWQQHAAIVARTLNGLPLDARVTLAGHSGAGVLLPAIRKAIQQPVAGYIFVDASIPKNGASRYDLFTNVEEVQQSRKAAVNGLLPTWTEQDLQEAILDPTLRKLFVSELQPLPVSVYEEPIPVFEDWPDEPCGYLKFGDFYADSIQYVRRAGWAYAEVQGSHFQMLNDPVAVTDALLRLSQSLTERQ